MCDYGSIMETKKCPKCGVVKSYGSFHKRVASNDGFAHKCKSCTAVAAKEWRDNNPERCKANGIRWKENNPGKPAEYNKRWRERHPEHKIKARERTLKKYHENKEEFRQYHNARAREYQQRYPERVRAAVKAAQNKAKVSHPHKYRASRVVWGIRYRSKTRGREFNRDEFSIEWLENLFLNTPNCECCGRVLDYSYRNEDKRREDIPSMDRVDNSKWYSVDNVAVLCMSCNIQKNAWEISDLRRLLKWLESRLESDKTSLIKG